MKVLSAGGIKKKGDSQMVSISNDNHLVDSYLLNSFRLNTVRNNDNELLNSKIIEENN